MTEREYERLLDVVNGAVGSDDWSATPMCDCPEAANDNDTAWPLAPFPEGWHASP